MTNEKFIEVAKLLSDSSRLNILQALSKNGIMCACKILEDLNITQGTLSHHMKVLSNAGLVSMKKEGKWCYYSLEKKNICEIAEFIQSICKTTNNDSTCGCKQ